MTAQVNLEKLVIYGIGIKTTTYFKLMCIYETRFHIIVFGLN
ncbi:hypothetical protein LCGC14_1111100 [marine sediment metagenome]|uniref:Uncharacterized protein n=1 Tax=marine sediment metagenome TaxID=412755 RepID=A0A0F9QCR7_9ZZZZ